jgi:multidrug efflux pump subunit AcrB
MKISDFAISNYQFTIILILLLVISGIVSLVTMPRSEDPATTPPGTSIIVIYPGASPADMEQLVVDPVEEKINHDPGHPALGDVGLRHRPPAGLNIGDSQLS